MKKNTIILLIICIISGGIIIYYGNQYLNNFKYAKKISGINIPYTSKIVEREWTVGDFDAATSIKLKFTIKKDNISDIENQCKRLGYRHILNTYNNRYEKSLNKKGNSFSNIIFNKLDNTLYIDYDDIDGSIYDKTQQDN